MVGLNACVDNLHAFASQCGRTCGYNRMCKNCYKNISRLFAENITKVAFFTDILVILNPRWSVSVSDVTCSPIRQSV